jgi:hypothetical protein
MSPTTAKDLTKEAPESPAHRVGGYVILARLADKARAAFLGGNAGEYHTDCPLDHMLLDWKGVSYAEMRKEIEAGADVEALAVYLDSHGTHKTAEEIESWSDAMDEVRPGTDPEKKEWFAGECARLGLDPETTTLFGWLETEDKESFGK